MTAKHFRLLAYAETNKYTNASDIIIVEYGVAYAHDSRSPDIVKHHAITRQSCRFGTQSTRDEPERKKQKCVVLKKNAHSQTNRILPSEHPHFAFNTTMTRKYPAHKNKHFRWVHFWCLFVCYSLVDANFNSSSSLTAIRSFFFRLIRSSIACCRSVASSLSFFLGCCVFACATRWYQHEGTGYRRSH